MQKLFFIFLILLLGMLTFSAHSQIVQEPSILDEILCKILPSNNILNTPIDNLPVDANSDIYVQTIGPSISLHPDFGAGQWNGAPIGIPYILVPGTQPKVNITFDYSDESEPGPYPIPPDAPIEGGPNSTGDRHVLIIDKDNCILYEIYSAYPNNDGTWNAGSGAIHDLNSNKLRPDGWTSADAAGLPILPLLLRYDEVHKGEINHAIRFTVPNTQRAYIWPARHLASTKADKKYPPMGIRFRLKNNYDITKFSTENQVILKALKKYGMILADNGSAWYITGAPDARWNDNDLNQLKTLKGSDFEAVDVSSLIVDINSGEARQETSVYTLKEESRNSLECYPNPAVNECNFTLPEGFNNIVIFDLYGNKVIILKSPYHWEISNSISSGIYIARSTRGNKSLSKIITVIK